MPTRFHYTQTAPTAFGLTAAEILMATDEELNTLMSVKHIAPYRKGGLGIQGKGLGKRVKDLKSSLEGRKWGEESWGSKSGSASAARAQDAGYAQRNGGAEGEGKKKRMGKNERKRKAAAAGLDVEGTAEGATGGREGDGRPMDIESQRRELERDAASKTVQGAAYSGGVHPSRLAQMGGQSGAQELPNGSNPNGESNGAANGAGADGEGKKRRKKKKGGAGAGNP